MRCIVKGCHNKFQKDTKLSFFMFPKDPNLLKKWIAYCKQPKDSFRPCWRICSDHFKEEEICGKLQKDMGFRGNMYIKPGVVPTRVIGLSADEDRAKRLKRREHKRIITSILQTNSSQHEGTPHVTPSSLRQKDGKMTVFVPEPTIDVPKMETEIKNEENVDPINVTAEVSKMESQIETLKNEVTKLRLANKSIKEEMSEKAEKHQIAIAKVRRKLKELTVQCKNVDDKLRGILTLNQIRILKTGQKNKKWTHADIANSVALYSSSAKSYNMLRKMDFPLPSVQTLHDWVQKLEIKKGVLRPVFKILSETRELTKRQKVCVLSIGAKKIQGTEIQIGTLRGLISKWKQPVFTEFNYTMTANTIKTIMRATNECGYKVVAIVCEIEGANEQLLNELEVHHEKPWFIFDDEKVYVFTDVRCLMKSLNTNFLNKGFIIDGKPVQKDIIASLLAKISGNPSIIHKIGIENLEFCGTQGQNVKLKAKLFSDTFAQAVNEAGIMGLLNGKNWEQCYKLFKTVKEWFDVMNANKKGRNTTPYGLELDIQNEALVHMNSLIKEMRVIGQPFLLPFQKGILQTNLALQLLYLDVKMHFQIDCILTNHLNQDALESVFEAICSQEGLHEELLDRQKILHRLRAYLLGQQCSLLTTSINVEIDDTYNHEKSSFPLTGIILSKVL